MHRYEYANGIFSCMCADVDVWMRMYKCDRVRAYTVFRMWIFLWSYADTNAQRWTRRWGFLCTDVWIPLRIGGCICASASIESAFTNTKLQKQLFISEWTDMYVHMHMRIWMCGCVCGCRDANLISILFIYFIFSKPPANIITAECVNLRMRMCICGCECVSADALRQIWIYKFFGIPILCLPCFL